jgi:hypothetical protein
MSDGDSKLTPEELARQESELLPDREVMSLLPTQTGGGLLGGLGGLGGGLPATDGSGTAAPTDTGGAPTDGLTSSVTNLAQHAGSHGGEGPYSGDETSSAA